MVVGERLGPVDGRVPRHVDAHRRSRNTGEIDYGRVPPYSVVVPQLPGKPLPDGARARRLYCAVIVKHVDEKTRAKTSINELLRG